MAHGTNYIQTINVGGTNYEIHDAQAIHDIADLNLANVLYFKGVKATKAELPTTGNLPGHVWHVTADGIEYVWVEGDDPSTSATETGWWEPLGGITNAVSQTTYDNFVQNGFMTHYHNMPSQGVTANGSVSNVIGSVTTKKLSATATAPTITVTPTTDEVLGSGTKFSGTAITSVSTTKLKATAGAPTVTPTTENVLGTDATITVTGKGLGTISKGAIAAGATGTAVGANGTATAITALGTPTTAAAITGFGAHTTADAITGFGAHTTAKAITAMNTVTPTAVTIPNVTGNTSVTASKVKTAGSAGSQGKAASWSASVSNHVLSFNWETNTPTIPATIPTFESVTATNTTLGTALTASKIGSAGTTAVATTSKSTADAITALGTPTTVDAITALGTPTTANAITGFGTHTTKTVLTGVKVTAEPTITVTIDGTVAGQVVTGVGSGTITASIADATPVAALTAVSVAAPSVTLATGSSGDVTVATKGTSGTVTVTADSTDRVTAMTGASATATAPTITVASGTTGDVDVVTAVSKGSSAVTVTGSTVAAYTAAPTVPTIQ